MYLQEAYTVLESPFSTVNELLEAYRTIAIEHGYLLAVVTRRLEDNPTIEPKLWQLLLALTAIEVKIKKQIGH